MRIAIKAILLIGITVYLVWAVIRYARPVEKQVCTDVRVCLRDSSVSNLVTESYVHAMLDRCNISPKGVCLSDISLLGLDSLLSSDPYVSRASCHFTTAGVLCIDITPRKPVLHVLQSDGDEYYMADNGDVMPAKLAEKGLCLATGHMKRAFAKQTLLPLAKYIYNDEFWNAQVEQIYVTPSGQVELLPRVGRHVVQLGDADRFRDKLQRLRFFYKYGMPKVGWNKYRVISLAYDGQIVCTK